MATSEEVEKTSASTIDKTNTKPEELEAIKKENERLRVAIQGLQKNKDEFEAFKKEQERSKLSGEERVKAEIEDIRKKALAAEAEREQLKQELSVQKLVNTLVADHGLRNPEFGGVIVGHFDGTKEDFDTFAKRVSADPKYAPVFGGKVGTEVKAPPARSPAPPGPAGGSSRRGTGPSSDEQSEKDKSWARSRYPGDEEAQKRLLTNLAKERARNRE